MVPYTPQQNGVAERKNRTLLNAARCMLKTSHMEQHFWEEAISIACYLQISHSALGNAIPFTLWYYYPPNVSHLKVFGAIAYVYVHEHHRSKLDDRCFKGRFIGYGDSNGMKAYKIYNSQTGKVVYSRSVKFDEDWLYEGKSSSGTLHMDGGVSIRELQPDVVEGDTTIKDAWRIKTSTRPHGMRFMLRKQLLGNRSLRMGTNKLGEGNRTGWIRKESNRIR